MPGMQFYGSIPGAKSPLAKVAERGVSGYGLGQQMKMKREAGALEERKLGLVEKKMDVDLKSIAYEKKRDTATMVIDVAKTLDPSTAETFVNDPKVKALFEDLDWPLPTGLKKEPDLKDVALEAVGKGESLPGMTMDETKKAAGILVPELKITGADVKAFGKEVPWWEKIIPGKQPSQRALMGVKKRWKGQFEQGVGPAGDPLGVR